MPASPKTAPQASERTTDKTPEKAVGQNTGSATGALGLADLFEHGLKDMYYAEKKIYKALPKMIKASRTAELGAVLSRHRDETAGQIEALEQVFELMGKRPKAVKCDAIDGILEEATGLLEDFVGSDAGDAAIIFSCQAVEHYEITRYGSLHAFAEQLKLTEVADILKGVLDEEHAADNALSALAESRINAAAA